MVFLPFYILYKVRKKEERTKVEVQMERAVEEYAEHLAVLATDIKAYNPQEYDEAPTEYLSQIQEEIESIAKNLKDFHNRLQDYHTSY